MNLLEKEKSQLVGIIKSFKSNKHGDIDAIELDIDKGNVKLKFPPHVARQVIETIAVGQQVAATYTEKSKPDKKSKMELYSVASEQQTDPLIIADKKPEKPTVDSPVETIKPEKFTLVRDKKEKPVAILTDDKLIHLHKDDAEIAAAIRPDSALTIQAVLRTDEGFVNEQNLPVYHIKSIDIDGRSFQPSKKK